MLLDLFGLGFRDKPVDFPYTIASHAAVVTEIVKKLGLKELHLFGHSMGGSVAIVAAQHLQHVLASLILSEPNLDVGGGVFSRGIAAYSEQDYCEVGYQQDIEQALASGNDVWAGSLSVSAAFAVYRAARSLVAGCSPSWREILSELTIPRTVLFGEHSLPDDDYDALPKLGITVARVVHAGHSMAWETPSGLASAIARSLETTEQMKI